MVYITKTRTILTFFCKFPFCREHYTLGIAGSQSWPYYIRPKRGKGQVCLTKQCLHPIPCRWRGLESHGEGGGGEGGKVLAMLKGGTKSFRVVLARELEVLAILKEGWGCKTFPPFKKRGGGRGAISFTLS